tara:strand:- start:70 stop:333 length:264 start_codon:yes stop_codon:yes gene_type:complete
MKTRGPPYASWYPKPNQATEDINGFACEIAHQITVEHFDALSLPHTDDDGESLTYTEEAQPFFDEWYDYIHYQLQLWSLIGKKEEEK